MALGQRNILKTVMNSTKLKKNWYTNYMEIQDCSLKDTIKQVTYFDKNLAEILKKRKYASLTYKYWSKRQIYNIGK